MKKFDISRAAAWNPALVALLAAAAFGLWLFQKPGLALTLRIPGTDHSPEGSSSTNSNPVLAGSLLKSDGRPGALPGAWLGFRGPNQTGVAAEPSPLARSWESAGPRRLWSVAVGEGYAGAAVANGRVYVMDYDQEKKRDALRCLSLADGKEIWRYSYPVPVKRNHGMSRTVPALVNDLVVAIGPKCHVVCLDAATGQLKWGLDMVRQFGATVPLWYNGQNPLLDGDRLVLAVGGPQMLLAGLNLKTGQVQWQTPNPRGWKMTHSSVMPINVAGRRQYVYCANNGVAGVSADNGQLLWETTAWKISIATVPSPLILDQGRIFLSGGYNAGALMLQLKDTNGTWQAETAFKLQPEIFGATQHTPIFHNGAIYGVRPDGKLVCLDLDGKVLWTSSDTHSFGLGPFLVANDTLLAMNDTGKLSLIEAGPAKFNPLAQAQVLDQARESWGPMTLAGGRLIVRDLTRMICLDLTQP